MEDVIIIGAGPAGLGASVYLSRYKVKHLIIGAQVGGYLNNTGEIQNYLGFPTVTGAELASKMKEHAEVLGAKIVAEEVTKVVKKDGVFSLTTNFNHQYSAKCVIYAVGTKHRVLGIPGEKELEGKGVSYCATCDGPFFKDKKVVVVGGGNAAGSAALILAEHAKEVTIFYRKAKPPMLPSYIDQIEQSKNTKLVCCTNLTAILGEEKVEKVKLDNPYRGSNEFATDGVFIEIGSEPNTAIIDELAVEKDDWGYIKTNSDQSTSVDNFYAVGDVTTGSNRFRQIVCAASEGAISALAIFEKLKK